MTRKNRYRYGAHLSEVKVREIFRCFALDTSATQAASMTGIGRPTINGWHCEIRYRIMQICEEDFPLGGEVELDESYFGATRVPGKRGRGAYGKTPVFGILERIGKVYAQIVPDLLKAHVTSHYPG